MYQGTVTFFTEISPSAYNNGLERCFPDRLAPSPGLSLATSPVFRQLLLPPLTTYSLDNLIIKTHHSTFLTIAFFAALTAASPLPEAAADPQLPPLPSMRGLPTGLPVSITSAVLGLVSTAIATASSLVNNLPTPAGSLGLNVPNVPGAWVVRCHLFSRPCHENHRCSISPFEFRAHQLCLHFQVPPPFQGLFLFQPLATLNNALATPPKLSRS